MVFCRMSEKNDLWGFKSIIIQADLRSMKKYKQDIKVYVTEEPVGVVA